MFNDLIKEKDVKRYDHTEKQRVENVLRFFNQTDDWTKEELIEQFTRCIQYLKTGELE
jgi:hypothetical protein